MRFKEGDWVKILEDHLHRGEYKGAMGKIKEVFDSLAGEVFVVVELYCNPDTKNDWCISIDRPTKRFSHNEVRLLTENEENELALHFL